MINSTAAYSAAIVADARRMMLKATLDIIDPDITYGTVNTSGHTPYSVPDQMLDRVLQLDTKYATLERNRWMLGGGFSTLPDSLSGVPGQFGVESAVLSGDDGTFADPPWVEITFSNVSILQACSVYFSQRDYDGYPVDFTVEVRQSGTAYHTESYTNNTARSVSIKGFTVYNPDAIRVTVTRWSLPSRRMRAVEIVPGTYEEWDQNIISTFTIRKQGNFTALTLPYGTCVLSMDNVDRRFEPRRKDGLFQSIEERQGIKVYLGPKLPDGTVEYKPLGIYYQANGGWKTGNNGITMTWNLVDIIGLLSDRPFEAPVELPTTLDGWVALLVSHLGPNFATKYHVDPEYASLPLTAKEETVAGQKCGQILLWLCQATQTWPRADAETGDLTVDPLWSAGSTVTLDNLEKYPTMKANEDIASVTLNVTGEIHMEGFETEATFNFTGTSASAPTSASITNPFINTEEGARTCARWILQFYGGNRLETVGRGNPASEIGDIDVVWLDESTATNGRLMSQTLQFSGGVLKSCQSVYLQADGAYLYEKSEVFNNNGSWTVPDGVTEIYLILVGGGQGGGNGEDGTGATIMGSGQAGADGENGTGGKVWYDRVTVSPGQVFNITIGAGGSVPLGRGGDSTFGNFSSASGRVYETGYSDVNTGEVYARTAVRKPSPNTGDGGRGGRGGYAGQGYLDGELVYDPGFGWTPTGPFVVTLWPGEGQPGAPGGSGCVIVHYDIPDETEEATA